MSWFLDTLREANQSAARAYSAMRALFIMDPAGIPATNLLMLDGIRTATESEAYETKAFLERINFFVPDDPYLPDSTLPKIDLKMDVYKGKQ